MVQIDRRGNQEISGDDLREGVSRMDDRDILALLLVVMMFLIGIAIGGHLLF